jgi:hypothetical protein
MQGKTLISVLPAMCWSRRSTSEQIELAEGDRGKAGWQVAVRCTVTHAKGKIPSDVPQDGMVATAIRHGGEIVE